MNMHELRLSRSVLMQMVLVSVVVIVLAIVFSATLGMIYFSNQQTMTGYILNALIVVLFLIAMFRLVVVLKGYDLEEAALTQFQDNLSHEYSVWLDGVDGNSMIAKRISVMEGLRLKRAAVPHQSIAAIAMASESARTGVIRFIHNVLILCGVLGTIISLSIALFGASSMLEKTVSSDGMGLVIHGMSTALSTTMTAIVCYLILTYFLASLQNIQTRLLSWMEELTAIHLLPVYELPTESISQSAIDLVKEAHAVIQALHEKVVQFDFSTLTEVVEQGRQQTNLLHKESKELLQYQYEEETKRSQLQHEESQRQLAELSATLRHGFRLSGE